MSVPFGKHYGATFKEIVIMYEALQAITFDDAEKERIRLSLINYTYSKASGVYPYQWDDYFHDTPTAKKPDDIANEIAETE